MAIKILANGVEIRKPGKTPSGDILGGNPVNLVVSDSSGNTIMVANGTTMPVGYAIETTVAYSDPTRFYDDYARGGMVSYVCGSGVEIEVWNDGRGDVFDTTQSYKVNQKLYVNANGLISNQSNGDAIGLVTKAPANSSDSLKLQSLI